MAKKKSSDGNEVVLNAKKKEAAEWTSDQIKRLRDTLGDDGSDDDSSDVVLDATREKDDATAWTSREADKLRDRLKGK